jgi:hypothetical protein
VTLNNEPAACCHDLRSRGSSLRRQHRRPAHALQKKEPQSTVTVFLMADSVSGAIPNGVCADHGRRRWSLMVMPLQTLLTRILAFLAAVKEKAGTVSL